MRAIILLMTNIILSGCSNFVSYEVSPELRQQLFTRVEGEPDAIIGGAFCLPVVDHSPLLPIFLELEPDEIFVGYQSYETPPAARPRCRRDVNIEHHAWVNFDLSPFNTTFANPRQGQDAELTSYILTGTPIISPDNENCSRGSLLDSVKIFGRNFLEHNIQDLPVPAGELRIDDNRYTIREASRLEGARNRYSRTDSRNQILFVFNASTLSSPSSEFSFTFIGTENPSWRANHRCIMRLKDIKLTIIFKV